MVSVEMGLLYLRNEVIRDISYNGRCIIGALVITCVVECDTLAVVTEEAIRITRIRTHNEVTIPPARTGYHRRITGSRTPT